MFVKGTHDTGELPSVGQHLKTNFSFGTSGRLTTYYVTTYVHTLS